jgi:protein-S-isoprenylcysteine O-methyltransferase Ste14
MPEHNHGELAGEMPGNHTYQLSMFVVFSLVWLLDSFFLHLTTFLLNIVPFWLPAIPAAVIFAVAVYLANASHRQIFHESSPGLLTTGVFSHVRHPLYLGTVLAYVALATLTASFASVTLCVAILGVYDRLAGYEEKELEARFGTSYLEYRRRVRKWGP